MPSPRHWVPNGLSLARLLLGLAFPFVPTDWRLGIILTAAVSDLLDGLAARWLGAESDLGRLLDPIADKVFVLVLVGTLLAEGTLGLAELAGIAARDLTVTVGATVVAARGRWDLARQARPSLLGKATTAGQFAVLLVAVGQGSVPPWLLVPVVALSVAAAAGYARRLLTPPPSPAA